MIYVRDTLGNILKYRIIKMTEKIWVCMKRNGERQREKKRWNMLKRESQTKQLVTYRRTGISPTYQN